MPSTSSTTKESKDAHPLTIRVVVEGVLSLMMAVVLCRFFLVDNYIVPTGSMALELLGYHKRVECPDCHYSFAHGVKEKDEQEDAMARCPNCGLHGIDISQIPRRHGDQLLVQKQAYALRQPHRWEIIVFWNPKDIDPPYVKRVVALPGESVQVIKGDVHVSGEICRKKMATQRAIRIPVYLHDFQPKNSQNWQPRWNVIPSESASHWKKQGNRFLLSASDQSSENVAVVYYQHWVRSGGQHETTVRVESSSKEFKLPDRFDQPISYSKKTGYLTCREGVLTDQWYQRLLELNGTEQNYVAAIHQLSKKSHIAPITDSYSYQQPSQSIHPVKVRDLMMSMEVTIQKGEGDFQLSMTDGRIIADCIVNLKSNKLELAIASGNEKPQVKRTVSLDAIEYGVPFLLEVSLMDRQVSVAVNETEMFSPWKYPNNAEIPIWWQQPVWFSARQLDVEVAHLSLYRDVHYTKRYHKNGVDEPFLLGQNEYFFLGDNSPVSFDSRGWRDGAVNGDLFIGKPFVVHLPSKPQTFKIGSWKGRIRIPDFSRMKYIR